MRGVVSFDFLCQRSPDEVCDVVVCTSSLVAKMYGNLWENMYFPNVCAKCPVSGVAYPSLLAAQRNVIAGMIVFIGCSRVGGWLLQAGRLKIKVKKHTTRN